MRYFIFVVIVSCQLLAEEVSKPERGQTEEASKPIEQETKPKLFDRNLFARLPSSCRPANAYNPVITNKRETHPITGDPIYEEGEPTPVGLTYHLRSKEGTFKGSASRVTTESASYVRADYVSPPQKELPPEKTQEELKVIYEKATPAAIKEMKGYVTTDEDGTPVFKNGSFPRPGVVYRVFSARMKGFR